MTPDRPGDPLEPREPESRWDHPVAVLLVAAAFWLIFLAILALALAVFG